MHVKEVLTHSMGMGDMIVDQYVGDLDDADLTRRPAEGMNPIAWQLGHLILTERRFVEMVRPGSCPPLPAGFDAAHDKDQGLSDETSGYRTREEYLSLFKAQREATKAVLADLPDEELDQPNSLGWEMVPTVGHLFELIGNHVLMHVGQFVPVRRKQGKPVVI